VARVACIATYNCAQVVAQALASPLPAGKVTLGLPFYGRRTGSGDWETYEDILQRLGGQPRAQQQKDVELQEPHNYAEDKTSSSDGKGVVYYNGPVTIERKVALALSNGLGGVMIWEAGQDCRLQPVTHGDVTHRRTCFRDDDSLLLAIERALLGRRLSVAAGTKADGIVDREEL